MNIDVFVVQFLSFVEQDLLKRQGILGEEQVRGLRVR